MADLKSDATQIQETFNAAMKKVCDTFGIEKFHKSNKRP